jgi:hypothetical protein
VPAGGRVTFVDIGAIALAVALGVGAWRFHPGQDARGARDRPTTTTEADSGDPAAGDSTTTAPGDPAAPGDPTATTAAGDPTATTAAPGPAPGAATPDPATSIPDGEAPATTAPASPAGPGSTTPTTDLS